VDRGHDLRLPRRGVVDVRGHRIQEELGGVGANTAVGRTRNVTGTLVIDDASITSLSVEVGTTALRSDDDRRDGRLRMRGLQTDTYPTATFELIPIRSMSLANARRRSISLARFNRVT
jgi:polyisoprenoid-binding protein YceI